MAIKTYRVGRVLIEGSQIFSLDNAALSITRGMGEVTSIGDDWRDLVVLGGQATLSLTCSYNPVDGNQALLRTTLLNGSTFGSVTMWEDTSHYFVCSAMLITTCNLTKAVGSVDKINFTLEAKGAVAYV
jgi:hypothetical protein